MGSTDSPANPTSLPGGSFRFSRQITRPATRRNPDVPHDGPAFQLQLLDENGEALITEPIDVATAGHQWAQVGQSSIICSIRRLGHGGKESSNAFSRRSAAAVNGESSVEPNMWLPS